MKHDVLLPAPRSPVAGFVLVIWKEEQNELEAVSILTAPSSLFTSNVLPESTSFRPGGSDYYYYYYCHCLLFFSNFYQHKSDFAKNMLSFKSVTIEIEITGGGGGSISSSPSYIDLQKATQVADDARFHHPPNLIHSVDLSFNLHAVSSRVLFLSSGRKSSDNNNNTNSRLCQFPQDFKMELTQRQTHECCL